MPSEAFLDEFVPAALDGVRLDRAISTLTSCSRREADELIKSGQVLVDGKAQVKGSLSLRTGQELVVLEAPRQDVLVAEADVAFTVLLEDPDFVVVDKPAGLVVHPGAGHVHGTLVSGILNRYPEVAGLAGDGPGEAERPGIVHRLDRGTSGLLVVARTELGLESLSEQIASHEAERTYWALVEGHVAEQRGVVDAPIGRSTRTPTKMAVSRTGRAARTHYEVLERLEDPPRSLLRCDLETGRTHQIRVHLAAIGHPVVNDPRYGKADTTALEEGRYALHAMRLAFDHPATGERVVVESEIPADLVALVSAS